MMKKYFIALNVVVSFLSVNSVLAQCTENFDGVTAPALPIGWVATTLTDCTGSNPWATGNAIRSSAPNAAFVNAPACVSDEVLTSKPYLITTPSAQLSFVRRYALEANLDGVVLEISISGDSFIDILDAGGNFNTGGYNSTISGSGNPLVTRQAWSGTSNTFIAVGVDLPSSVYGKIVVFRWRRGTNSTGTVTGAGFYLDNVNVTGCSSDACPLESFDTGITIPALPFGWATYTRADCAGSDPWVTANTSARTAPNSVFVTAPTCVSEEFLYSKVYYVGTVPAQILFSRNINLQTNYDGLVLEVSIDGEAFRDIIVAGGNFQIGNYNGLINSCCNNPIKNRSAWTGNSNGWLPVRIDLPAYSRGKTLVLRWRRGTDHWSTETNIGAYIDSVAVTNSVCTPVCATNITLTPVGGNLCNTFPVVLTASPTPNGEEYEWYRNNIKIEGVTGNTYTAKLGGIYYVKSNISGCLATSNVAVLESGAVPAGINGSGIYCSGSSVDIQATGTLADHMYTWKKNGVIVNGPISGGADLSYVINVDAGTVGDYVIEATKTGCVTAFSDTAFVRLPDISGLSVVKTCSNSVTVKWNRVIKSTLSQTYYFGITTSANPPPSAIMTTSDSIGVINSLSPNQQYYFHVRAFCHSSGFGGWSTIPFTTLPTNNSLTLSPANATICNGNPVTLTASGGGSTYALFRNGSILYGSNSPNFLISTAGTYTVTSEVNGCTITSNSSVVITATLMSNSLSGSGVYCTDELVDLRSTTVSTQQYSWYRTSSSTPVYGPIGGGNGGNQSYVVAMSDLVEGTYYVKTSTSGCETQSNYVTVYEAAVKNLFATNICATEASFNWSSIPTEFQYVVTQDSIPPFNPINPVFTLNNNVVVSGLLASTLYYFHARARASNSSNSNLCDNWTTLAFTTKPVNYAEWIGELSTTWSNPANWNCGVVPVTNSEVVINGNSPNYPVITSNITIKKLTVNPGASVTVQPGVNLTITSQ
jgi:hypothetical protein